MDLKLRAQSAMEFLALAGILLFVCVAFYAVIFTRVQDINDKKALILGEDIAVKVQKEILLAARVSDGYQRQFILSDKVEGMNYSISISGKELTVRTPKTEIVKTIPVVDGEVYKGPNTIRKTDGIIYIN